MEQPRSESSKRDMAHVFPGLENIKRTQMLDMLRHEPGVTIEDHFDPRVSVGPEDTTGLEELPAAAQKQIPRLIYGAHMYLNGFLMTDGRSTDDRNAWEADMQHRYEDDFNAVYAASKLRVNVMTRLINPLTFLCYAIKNAGIDTPKAKTLLALEKKLPMSLMPPYQKEVYDPESKTTILEPVPRYNALPLEEKRAVVGELDAVAREALTILTEEVQKEVPLQKAG